MISQDINTARRDYAQRAETCGILSVHRWRSRAERATDEAMRDAYGEIAGRLDVLARQAAEVEAALSELASTMRDDFRDRDRDVASNIVRAYAARIEALVAGDAGEEAGHAR